VSWDIATSGNEQTNAAKRTVFKRLPFMPIPSLFSDQVFGKILCTRPEKPGFGVCFISF
jgi:hypothetical protein